VILFANDWNKYPHAIVDHLTRNKSFLELADLYRKMGIKNNDFILALVNPSLQGIDPFSPDLTEDQIDDIVEETLCNPWYYYREIARIVPQGSMDSVPIRANRGIIALAWCFFNHIDIFSVQPRQTGKSVGADVTSNYVINVAGRGTRISLLTKDDELRVANVERLKKMRDAMPAYLNPFIKGQDLDNQNVVTAERYGNKLATAVGRASEIQALNVGRGITSPIVDGDEFPFIPHIETVFQAMLSSTNAARKTAKENNGFYGNYFTTTAGRKTTASGAYIYDLIHGGMPFSEKLFDCKNNAEAQKLVFNNRRDSRAKPLVNATFNHRQLGISDQEHYENLLNSNARGEIADMDYFNIWVSGGRESPIPPDLLKFLNQSIVDPSYTEITKLGYLLRWFVPEQEVLDGLKKRRMVLGLDLSDGIGKDSIALVMVDADTLETIMTANIVQTNLYLFGEFIGQFLIDYKTVTLIPERKMSGQSLIDSLLIFLPSKGEDPFKRIYSTLVEDREYDKEQYRPILSSALRTQSFYDRCKRYFGYGTSGTGRHSRDNLYKDSLINAVKMSNAGCRDGNLIGEISTLEVRDGRLDHGSGKHDDMVMAWMMACWMLISTKNLEFYGLHGSLQQISSYEDISKIDSRTSHDHYKDKLQKSLKVKANGLLAELAATNDDIVAGTIQQQLKGIDERLCEDMEPSRSLDSMIQDALSRRAETIRDAQRTAWGQPSVSYGSPFGNQSRYGWSR
jgi:hypothetical protein